MKQKKLLTMLVLLAAVATGAWAQSGTPSVKKLTVPNTWTGDMTTFSAADLPSDFAAVGDDVVTTIPAPTATGNAVLIYGFSGGETKYVEYANGVQSATNSRDFPRDQIYGYVNIMGYEGVYYTAAAGTSTTYSVTLAEGTEDAKEWTISPTEAAEGAEVTATYNGEKKVKSVKAVKVANVWDGDLSKLTAESTPEYATATDGMTITGTLAEGVNVKVSIADKATVTLDNVTINGVHKGDLDYMWAGLTCLGDATIILKDGTENKITGFHDHFPAIYIPGDRHNPDNNKTLIIKGGDQGTGKLIARNNGYAAAIGGVKSDASLNQLTLSAGNIEIQGGDIEAYAGEYCAAIGAAASDTCGYIRISGGKILANGSSSGVGIGCGTGMNELSQEAHCGDITITGGNITAYGTGGAAIGSCVDGVCGNITISGGIVMAVGQRYGCPGIGSGYKERFETRCGDILINGGVIQAVGLSSAPGIGCGGRGEQSGTCGNITITSGVTGLYAERGTGATNSIGLADNEGQCGTVTIGGTVYWQNGNYVGEGAAYLQDNPIRYEP